MKPLTEREREILQHLATARATRRSRWRSDISHDTVKLHVRHILSKLGLSSRVEAAVFAVEHRAATTSGSSAGRPFAGAGSRRRPDARGPGGTS